ncbi:MAG: molybdopterin-binding protein [Bacteroidales bacterium]|nr:molybdopterin-binding protein [Bacteroidales bacterium]
MNSKIKVISVNISVAKGTIKLPVDEIILNDRGVETDAHAGKWHRQVSMLGTESVNKFSEKAKRKINYGEFAENITTEGMLLYETLPLDRFISNNTELEVTQIGKECHGSTCAIFREVGNCVMPKEGIFCRVMKGGNVKAGDEFEYIPRIFSFMVITLSDRASSGEYEDKSGPRIIELLNEFYADSKRQIDIEHTIIPDHAESLELLIHKALQNNIDFIITTGGTGIGPKDITPDVVMPMLDKELPGIMDMIRLKYGTDKPGALLSRSVAGIIDNSFIFTLPGSVKAVNEYMKEIMPLFNHLVYTVNELDLH